MKVDSRAACAAVSAIDTGLVVGCGGAVPEGHPAETVGGALPALREVVKSVTAAARAEAQNLKGLRVEHGP